MVYGELEASLKIDKEAKLAVSKDNASSVSTTVDEVEISLLDKGYMVAILNMHGKPLGHFTPLKIEYKSIGNLWMLQL